MEKKDIKNGKKHLPLYGIGPALCYSMALITAVCIWMAHKGYIPEKIDNKAIKLVFLIIGIALIIEGIVLFFGADLNGNLQENMFWFGCTGALLIYANWILLALPFLFWIEMTVVLKNTEEKWLANLYGQEYIDYCKRVNRCIPWLPRKHGRGE